MFEQRVGSSHHRGAQPTQHSHSEGQDGRNGTQPKASHQHATYARTKAHSEGQPDYEKLGRLLFAIGQTGTSNRKKLYRIAFWKGIWGGLGGVIGATIVVALLLWLFSILGRVPLIGPSIQYVEQTLSAAKEPK